MIANSVFLASSIKHSCLGMRYFEKVKQGGLLDFILNTLVSMVAGKGFFAHSIKQFGIEGGRIVYLFGLSDQNRLLQTVVVKIRSYSQGQNILTAFKACFKGDDFFSFSHVDYKLNSFFMI